ncbi:MULTISPECIES: plantaricin C family lantibiotic [Bacillus]|uniref:Plantaricin C family lantibiotic n=1 Tax=Bacillus thuringiensis TaxID=1428 RepID=A0A9X7BH85_BACTU|nr:MULTISPECIES: plantaricin C family lantibiotic [Bacillus]EEM83103.1 hypothetical protein bthur0011_29350 [Bacillus thuringiensis serovar huazhongensis BGSC 4BD1]MED3447802.1 plantaricin C family lantibiotic [Bacillus thuringiensis]MED4441507.1 plantaricin C family lantibiotic [Bacillus cereus]PEB47748.1 plantaricin C family lantibiotic [Bacillus thuringiensis]PED23546.1 plantaricin C family lantibiotic [Bacillus thuringiensis]
MLDIIKNRKKVKENLELPDTLLEEVEEHSAMGGINTWNTTATSTSIIISETFGNKGKVCTYTVECVNNCRG